MKNVVEFKKLNAINNVWQIANLYVKSTWYFIFATLKYTIRLWKNGNGRSHVIMDGNMSLNFSFLYIFSIYSNNTKAIFWKQNPRIIKEILRNLWLWLKLISYYRRATIRANGLDDIHFSSSGNPSQYFFQATSFTGWQYPEFR